MLLCRAQSVTLYSSCATADEEPPLNPSSVENVSGSTGCIPYLMALPLSEERPFRFERTLPGLKG
jgi:hypothetical protein